VYPIASSFDVFQDWEKNMFHSISGNSRVFMIIADPVFHLKTPQAFNQRFQNDGVDAVLVPVQVGKQDLGAFIDGLRKVQNLDGLIVTIPHKQAAASLCDELLPTAHRAGSVNAIKFSKGRMIGENFDGQGFVQGLTDAGYDLRQRNVLMLGSGGAASSIAFALADAGVRSLAIWNRNMAKANMLVSNVVESTTLSCFADPSRGTGNIDLIVNATSLGMNSGDALPVPAESLLQRHMVAEVIMSPEETPLLIAAKAAGAQAHPGKHMLSAQLEAMGKFIGAF
jgi:shikimate dehydrogenase